jgi:Tol biopolymer transport system component
MSLSAGTRLGPYEILALIGAGGMGEVYRARDERLRREVAVKVLPASLSTDSDRLRRFEQEAQAAGTLNHPNITAVYDVGTHEGSLYVVSELLEGETLRSRLAGGPLPLRKATDYAIQIAQGLAAAHEKGIVHRDLKPENLFVTRDGRVKILDFGLAKLMQPAEGEGSVVTSLPTATAGTEPGVVLGTLGYMSPEQVRGRPADARSDIFAFGAVLYEMLTGKRAFHRDTAADTMSAILKEEPPDVSLTNQSVPPGLERIVRHCLEKNPEERFHSAHDLAFDLQALSGASIPAARSVVAESAGRTRILRPAIAAVVLAAIAAGAFLAGRRSAERPLPSFRRLTFRRGAINGARFAPDGQSFVYSALWEGKPSAAFLGRRGTPEPSELPLPEAALLGVSSSGELAIQMSPRFVRGFTFGGTLARVPLAGGTPRELLEDVHWADWMPDGNRLAVVHDAGGKNRLEFPAGKPVYETAGFISHPRISPRGDLVAFLDHPVNGDDGGSVAVVDAAGKKRTLGGVYSTIFGLAWRPDGSEVWFTAAPSGSARALRAVTLDGRERLLAGGPGILEIFDTAADGRALVSSSDFRLGILGLAPGETKERDLSWLDWSLIRDMSPDGRFVLFDETGEGTGEKYGVYLRRTDGSAAVRLGDGSAMALSPDGKWVLAVAAGPPPRQLVLFPTGAGEPRRITADRIEHHAGRFVDARTVVFAGNEPGRAIRLYAQDIAGGGPRPISPEGVETSSLTESSTGWVVGLLDRRIWLYSTRGQSPRPVPAMGPGDRPLQFSPDGRTLYIRRGELPIRVFRLDLATGRSEPWKEMAPADPAGLRRLIGPRMSADGKAYAYTYARQLSDLYLVEGLK